MSAGQFGVVKTKGFVPWVIRLATRSQVNHAYVFVDDEHIVEAEPKGARITNASKYGGSLAPSSHFCLSDDQAQRISDEALALVGTPYNFLDIAALALLSLGIRWKWLCDRAQSQKRLMCSQLVDRAYRNAGLPLYTDGRPDGEVTPGDLLLLLADQAQLTRIAHR